jgi:hypothetical protein
MMDDHEEFLSVFDMSEKTQPLLQLKELAINGEKSEDSVVNSHLPSPNRLSFLQSHRISTNNRNSWIHFPNRLLFRVPDSHAATGFIKEVCFSSCNNLICSPYYRGYNMHSSNFNNQHLSYSKNTLKKIALFQHLSQSSQRNTS